jgi:nitroimidazol reductase NimA-like FMN-containing flavoprotein (pyridoxamine 5'-phosphate oxidase superfamily)
MTSSPVRITGPWSAARIARFLDETVIPIRLGCVTASGWPLVAAHWFIHRDGHLWCATQADARIVRALRADGRCAFEVATNEMPYRGVRGRGRAHIDPAAGEATLRALVDRYLGSDRSAFAAWLLRRIGSEVAVRIEPQRLRAWDYSRRMASAVGG